jgi:hypothetical protein
MKRSRFFNPLVAFVLVIAFCAAPIPVSATQAQLQTGTTVTATGQMCDASGTYCYPMQFSFDPAGGPVTGSSSGSLDLSGPGYTAIQNTSISMNGTFAGGDGGAVGGTLSVHSVGTLSMPGFPDQSATHDDTGTWEGYLRADGTGDGTVSTFSVGEGSAGVGIWSVTYSADEFQAGLNAGKITPEYIFQTYGITVESGDKDWSDHELQLLNDVLKNLPPSFRDKLALQSIIRYESKWDVTTGKLKPDTFGDYSAWDQQRAGFAYARSAQTIRIFDRATQPYDFNNDETGDIEFKATILHEMTHALQYYNYGRDPYIDPAFQSPLVIDYYNNVQSGSRVGWFEKNRVWTYKSDPGNDPPTAYGQSLPTEDISESVMMYVYDPQKLAASSPLRYNYIRTKIFGGTEYENGKQKGQ